MDPALDGFSPKDFLFLVREFIPARFKGGFYEVFVNRSISNSWFFTGLI